MAQNARQQPGYLTERKKKNQAAQGENIYNIKTQVHLILNTLWLCIEIVFPDYENRPDSNLESSSNM